MITPTGQRVRWVSQHDNGGSMETRPMDELELCRITVTQGYDAKRYTGQNVAEYLHAPELEGRYSLRFVAEQTVRMIADVRTACHDDYIRVWFDQWHTVQQYWSRAATLKVRTVAGWTSLEVGFMPPEAQAPTIATLEAVALEAERYGWNAADVLAHAARLEHLHIIGQPYTPRVHA